MAKQIICVVCEEIISRDEVSSTCYEWIDESSGKLDMSKPIGTAHYDCLEYPETEKYEG